MVGHIIARCAGIRVTNTHTHTHTHTHKTTAIIILTAHAPRVDIFIIVYIPASVIFVLRLTVCLVSKYEKNG